MKSEKSDGHVTVREMSERLHVSRQALYEAIADGRLSCVIRYGRQRGRLITVEEMERFEREELVPAGVM